jgi:hypothetical protein
MLNGVLFARRSGEPFASRLTLIVISTAAERDGWFPEGLAGMEAVSSALAEQVKQTPIYTRYAEVAPHPQQFPLLLDRMGELMRKDYDWRSEIAKLPMPALCCSPITTLSRRNT